MDGPGDRPSRRGRSGPADEAGRDDAHRTPFEGAPLAVQKHAWPARRPYRRGPTDAGLARHAGLETWTMTIVTKKTANVDLKEGPIEVRSQAVDGWNVAFESWPAGPDYKPLFHGL